MTRQQLVGLNLGLKALLVGLLLFAVARPDLPQFHGKAVIARAAAYPIVALVVPAVWLLRGRRERYPHDIDILVVLPFAIDTAGNALNLYDTVSWWDDANHFVNWSILVAGFGRLLARFPLGRLETFGLVVGFGGGDGDSLGVRRVPHRHPLERERASHRLYRHAR